MQIRDLLNENWAKFEQHYDLYSQQIAGLGQDMASIEVATAMPGLKVKVGTKKEFIDRLKQDRKTLAPLIEDVYNFVKDTWQDEDKYAYIFEMAQAIGLDPRFGVYPDITGSDTTFTSITASTEGIVDYKQVEHRILTMKATYSSSVGVRKLPTNMIATDLKLANKIREDAREYGATTKRPRDIVFLDLPAARFYSQNGSGNEFAITHMDIVYKNTPIKICTDYQIDGKIVAYRPDQEFLNTVTPIYKEIPTWDQKQINLAKNYNEVPQEAKDYVEMIVKELGSPVTIITNGPKREQLIKVTS
jgi:adenylosuccinate synthase